MMRTTRSMTILALLAVAVAAIANMGLADEPRQPKLLEVLKSSAPQAEKAMACKLLAVYGNQDAVPALAALLPDKELSSWARIALEAIPGEAANAALRGALDKLQGRLLIGVVNSLGVRRDVQAVAALAKRLSDADVEVASAAACALGHIGGDAAAKALEPVLAAGAPGLRSATAEGCILCAERLVAQGKAADAVTLYQAVCKANVPSQRVLEATRGMIVARGAAGVPLLVELLQSTDKQRFALGLRVARELAVPEVTDALLAQLKKADAQRQSLLIQALADRGDAAALPAVIQAVKSGPAAARCAAIRVLKRLGNVTCVPVLLDAAVDANEQISETALAVLSDLPGADVDKDLTARLLSQAPGKLRTALIELAGSRTIAAAVPALWKAVDDADVQVRIAAFAALGATIEFSDLAKLIQRVALARGSEDDAAAEKALSDACQRMPDREACAEKLIAAMAQAPVAVKCRLLEILSNVGGAKALTTMSAAVKGDNPELRETASRLLGNWMAVDAAPVLLDLAKNSADEKYKVRALRGYIRLLRQFDMSDEDRVAMCRAALEAAQRTAEKKLILEVMGRYPSRAMLSVALEATRIKELRNEAIAVAMLIAQKSHARSAELQKLLAQSGRGLVKIEIIKAEYGAGTAVKDVTTILRKHVHDFPVIILPSPSYNATFGGDPAPGVVKQLKVQYRMGGKAGEVSFQENASIELPKP